MPPTINVTGTIGTLQGAISIDSGPDASSFLANIRLGHTSAAAHDSMAAAITNIRAFPTATLVGHGQTGIINTGAGNVFSGLDRFKNISIDNIPTWTQEIGRRPESITSLMLFGCNVGAGVDGARLVWELARALNAKVTAPLGQVWASPPTFQPCFADGETFQEATPEMTQPPAAKPAPRLAPAGRPASLILVDAHRFVSVPVESVRATRLLKRNQVGLSRWHESATPEESQVVVTNVSFEHPLIFPAPLATVVTGRLFVTYRFLGEDVTREFLIHNDLMLEDVSAPGVFYEVDVDRVPGA